MINFYDTSALLIKIPKEYFYISSVTIAELENIKTAFNKDYDIKTQARKLSNWLSEHTDKYTMIRYTEEVAAYLPVPEKEATNDMKILATAVYLESTRSSVNFFTNDNNLFLFARELELAVEKIKEENYTYTGIKEILLSDEELEDFYYHLDSNYFNLYIGQYLIIKNVDGEIVDTRCYDGKTMRPLHWDDIVSTTFGRIKPIKNDPYQACLFDSLQHNQVNMITGLPGSGKAQPNSTLIPTLNGYKKLGDIKVGDKILDRFGKETTVLGVFPQGKIDNYKLTFSDQRTAYCNEEHLWSCYTSRGNLKSFTVKEMLESGLKKHQYKFKIPMPQAVEYEEKDFPVDPYVIGVFLGDGCCLEDALTLSSNDLEIVEEVSKLINAVEYYSSTDKNYSYNFYKEKNQNHIKGKRCRILTRDIFEPFQKEIVQYSYNKKIPDIYKYGSIAQRFSLIQGLMDTDGSIDNSFKGRVNFNSTSLQLVKDLQEICWSLGLSATISEDKREKYTNSICYELMIHCSKEIKPKLFRLKRKKKIAIEYSNQNLSNQHKYDKLSIISIEKCLKQEEMTCLYVDNPEHLYLTEQFIVTHNTMIALAFLFSLLDRTIDRIIIFCNPVAAKSSAKLGFYPGTVEEKLLSTQIGHILTGKLGDRGYVEQLVQDGKIVLIPAADARGYEVPPQSAVLISEAQNHDVELMKLLLQRCGDDTIVICEGDVEAQVDIDAYAGDNNGLKAMSKAFRGDSQFGQVDLKFIHRSHTANLAEKMGRD